MSSQAHMVWKTKWRWIGGVAHCFIKSTRIEGAGTKGYTSLCSRHTLPKAYGGSCRRPPPLMRCAICDGAEMDILGWDQSGDESKGWEDGCP